MSIRSFSLISTICIFCISSSASGIVSGSISSRPFHGTVWQNSSLSRKTSRCRPLGRGLEHQPCALRVHVHLRIVRIARPWRAWSGSPARRVRRRRSRCPCTRGRAGPGGTRARGSGGRTRARRRAAGRRRPRARDPAAAEPRLRTRPYPPERLPAGTRAPAITPDAPLLELLPVVLVDRVVGHEAGDPLDRRDPELGDRPHLGMVGDADDRALRLLDHDARDLGLRGRRGREPDRRLSPSTPMKDRLANTRRTVSVANAPTHEFDGGRYSPPTRISCRSGRPAASERHPHVVRDHLDVRARRGAGTPRGSSCRR